MAAASALVLVLVLVLVLMGEVTTHTSRLNAPREYHRTFLPAAPAASTQTEP
jgi:hypothetical protein